MLLTIDQVAERLQCSPSHVRCLARAAELRSQPAHTIPPRLRSLTDLRFPRPRYLSAKRRMARIDERELMRWLEEFRC
jgi:hypothetical protein